MSYNRILLNVENGIARITLNRPDKRNALDRAMVDELREAFESLDTQQDVRVVVLTGSGKAFCAGADLAYLQHLSTFSLEENREDSSALAVMFLSIWNLSKPVIARVQGHAIAGGCGLATICDVVVAVESAKFGYTEVGIGFIPAIVMAFLLRKSPRMKIQELLLSGTLITAREASERGLITRVVEDEATLDVKVDEICRSILNADPGAIAMTKSMLNIVDEMSLPAAIDYASTMNAVARMTPACQEGIKNFLEKRNNS